MCNLFSKVTTQACTVLPHFVLIVELKDKQRLAPLKKKQKFTANTERRHAETRK